GRLPGSGGGARRAHGLRERPFRRAGAVLGGVALRDAGRQPPPGARPGRAGRRRARRVGRRAAPAHRALRPPLRRLLPLLGGLPPGADGRRRPPGVAPAPPLPSSPAALGHGAQVHGGIRDARRAAARRDAGERRGAPAREPGGARMRVLVTGGAGYIGSVTVAQLCDAGHEVTVLDSLAQGPRAAVDARAAFVEGDLAELRALRRL